MNNYHRNRACGCVRCRAHGLMGAAVLITLGVLFLLENYYVVSFDRSFPVLLLVIGAVMMVSRTGSTEGHIQPVWGAPAVPAPPPQQTMSAQTPPPPPQSQPWREDQNPDEPKVNS